MTQLPDKEVEEMKERLARVEVSLGSMSKQLDHMVNLLIRVVKVEERMEEDRRDLTRLYTRIETMEKELATWASVRKTIGWVTGISGSIIAGLLFFREGGPPS